MGAPTTNPYRLLPSVEEALALEPIAAQGARVSRGLLVGFVQETLERWRAEIKAGELDAKGVEERLARGDLLRSVEARVERERGSGLRRVINAAGVVLHTGLGRAPVHMEAAAAMARAASGYCTLEVDRFTGRRNQRDDRLAELLVRLTGAEAGIVVNNNAAAVVLLLNTFAQGKSTIVSRGELVEIGGSFRMPDVMERAGTRLVEVGTTNRTRIGDYRAAAKGDVALLLKVHTSNYRVVGFTEEVEAADLALLGRELGLTTCFDLGSGLLEGEDGPRLAPLLQEPLVRAVVASGVDIVTFSGDKLLGGPQAGLVVGKRPAVERMRKNPLYRALRLDKVTIAGLEKTLELYLTGREAEVPSRAMLSRSKEELRPIAERLARSLAAIDGITARAIEDRSQPGSGSAPTVYLPTWVVKVRAKRLDAETLAARLRAADPPVFARIHEDELVLDPRTLFPGEEDELVACFRSAVASQG